MIYKVKNLPTLNYIENIFFVGVKGVGMMPLSIIAKEAGINVAGSDLGEEFITDKYLNISGVKFFNGFEQNYIHDFFKDLDTSNCLVVTTGAHGGFDNPQVKWAKKNGFNVLSQGQALGVFMGGDLFDRSFKGVAVAGSHGKTTISSLLASSLSQLGDDCSYSVGTGEVFPIGSPGHYGSGEFFVAEADEYASEPVYDRVPKFLYLNPNFAIFNNVDFDHPDLFSDVHDIEDGFVEFAHNIKSGGILFVNGDDRFLKNIRKKIDKDIKIIFYGEGSNNDYIISKIVSYGLESKFTVSKNGTEVGVFELSIPGVHNAKNALAVIAFLLEAGFQKDKIRSSVSAFLGTKRRLEKVGRTNKGAIIFDDYGHHPVEIQTTIKALKEAYPEKKIICIFQPHTFSRTKALLGDFNKSFNDVFELMLLPVFKSQRNTETALVEEENFLTEYKKNVKTNFFNNFEDVIEYVSEKRSSEEYLILTIGAGDLYKIAYKLKND